MVEKFHPDKGGEPCWGLGEEFITVGGDVEVAEGVGKGGHHERGQQGDRIDEEDNGDVRGKEDQICAIALASGEHGGV